MDLEYIYPSQSDAIRLNDILWNKYVWDGSNYIFPFSEGTICYYDVNNFPWTVTDLLIYSSTDATLNAGDRDFINLMLASKKTYSEALAAGWLNLN